MPAPKTHLDDQEIEDLRRSIKENGLERAVQLMGVTQRGLARRAIREGLQLLLEHRKRAAEGVVQQPAFPTGSTLEADGTP